MDSLLTRLVQLERQIIYNSPPCPGEDAFLIVQGQIPVLLSAAHGAVHHRNGRTKDEDEYTAGITRLLGEQTGAHVIYLSRKTDYDPNYDLTSPYKQALKNHLIHTPIKFVLDIHGCSPDREFGLALGTMKGKSCPNHREGILRLLESKGFNAKGNGLKRLDVDHTFSASGNHQAETVTGFVSQQLHIDAAQIEINAHLRIVERLPQASFNETFRGQPEGILNTISTLTALIMLLAAS